MLSKEQVSQIGLLSDTILYPESVALIRQLVRDEECDPLPTSQVTGLLNVAASATYDQLYTFVVHQRERNWPASKSDIPKFYTAFEKYLTLMQKKRLKDEFHLLTEGLNTKDAKEESDALMVQLAQNFIQHLVAENGLFVAAQADARTRQRANRNR
jgi:hypothetical protein